MTESFNPYLYVTYVKSRWRLVLIACAAAVALSVLFTLVTSKQYTATTRVIIEPSGNDSRLAMTINQVYLDSLHTYEHFVTSDSLFLKAMEKFDLRPEAPGRSIESWKNKTLKVGIVRNTRVLEIEVTLDDPRKAQALAQFLAEEAIRLNLALNQEAGQEAVKESGNQLEAARKELEEAEAAWNLAMRTQPLEALESEMQSLDYTRLRIERSLLDLDTASGRADLLRRQLAGVTGNIARVSELTAERSAARRQAEDRYKTAQALYETVRKQNEEMQATAGYRGERLRLIDPGIVPERPSSPGLLLTLMAATLLALAVSLAWVSIEYTYLSNQFGALPRWASKAADD